MGPKVQGGRGDRTIGLAAGGLLLALAGVLHPPATSAQGILTVTPGRSVATTAGNGSRGYTGDAGAALAATLARPSGLAYDSAGNLFLADANNHVIREISVAGVITTVAGTGTAGFAGDGGAATSALLDTPTSVAVDGSGNIYIADSHNHRIREVSAGNITTVAGNGTAGFSGDGSAATAAQLALPTGLALDPSGNLYIADTNNQRIRKVAAGTITTVAGNGEELFAGDGGAATAASLDQPTGVAVDSSGNLYIADKNNQRVRIVSPAGVISTLAGNGTGSFSGAFGGDGSSATAAALARPLSLSVDPSGNVYVADTDNQRIRQISPGGAIVTVAGTGDQGFGGDGGPATGAILNSPHSLVTDASGNLVIADTRNQRLRAASQGQITFPSAAVGATSSPQPVTLSNTGTTSLTVATVALTGPFSIVTGGNCPTAPVTLAPGASCTFNVAYHPYGAVPGGGALVFNGPGLNSQTVLLAGGVASQGITTLALLESQLASLSGESVTFTATLNTPGASGVAPTGSVSFYAGATLLGSVPVVNGVASYTANLPDGAQTITATYSGGSSFLASSSTAIAQNVADYTVTSSASETPTVEPGRSVAVPITVTGIGVSGLSANVVLTASGLPAGFSASFSPATAPLGNGNLAFTLNLTAAPVAANQGAPELGTGGAVLATVLLPLLGRRRANAQKLRRLLMVVAFAAGGALLTCITGCGASTGFFGQAQKTVTVTVTAAATDTTGGTLTRTTAVPILVQ